jgi:hypothetical protein
MATTLSVGSDQAYHTIADAVAASHAGDTIAVQAGTYTNDWSQIGHDLTIVGVGGMAHLVSNSSIDNGKAMLVTNGNVTVQNLDFSGASVGDHNGAGIRHESGHLTVTNCSFHDNQEGILAGDNMGSSMTVQNSSFVHNGAGDGQSHGLYVGQIASLSVDGSTFSDQVMGNQLKSRAADTTVSNSHFSTGPDGANYDIDLPNGGNANIHDNTFEKGATTNNPAIIHFGGEIDNAVGNLTVTHNNFSAEIPNATAVLNQSNGSVEVTDNALSNVAHIELGGFATLANNTTNGSLLDLSGGSSTSTSSIAPISIVPSSTATSSTDTGSTDTSSTDTSPVDTSSTDTSSTDTSAVDTSAVDTSIIDTSVIDTSSTDTSSTDTVDTSTVDTSTNTTDWGSSTSDSSSDSGWSDWSSVASAHTSGWWWHDYWCS